MWDEATQKEFGKLRLIAGLILLVAPLVYIGVAVWTPIPRPMAAAYEIMFYILLLLSMLQPAAAFVVEHSQISNFKRQAASRMSTPQLLFTIGISKLAMVESIFIYGLVMHFLGANLVHMLAFYPIGIAWGIIHWPRRERWEKSMESLERV